MEKLQTLPIHFFTIVLNGKPFIEHHIKIFNELPFDWHWHIIEGVADLKNDTSWSVSLGGKIDPLMHDNGRSNDGTTEYLDELKSDHNNNITIYRKPPGVFWDGKIEMVNAPLLNIYEECILFQIDVDEFWDIDQLCKVQQLFVEYPRKTAAFFYCHFFVGPKLVVKTKNTFGNNSNYEWLRAWRYKPDDKWFAHEPPTLCRLVNQEWINLSKINPFLHHETESLGLIFHHYAYVIEKQLRFKEYYYGYKNAVLYWYKLQNTNNLPILLKNYFPWVKDQAEICSSESLDIKCDESVAAYKENIFEDLIYKNLLYIRLDSIGDAVLSMNIIENLSKKFSNHHITVICQTHIASLYTFLKNVIVLSIDVNLFINDEEYRQNFLIKLLSKKYDIAINSTYSRSLLGDILATSSGAANIIGNYGDECNLSPEYKSLSDKKYTNLVYSSSLYKSELERNKEFLNYFGNTVENYNPFIFIPERDEIFADEFYKSYNLDKERTIVLFAGAQNNIRYYQHYGIAINEYCKNHGITVIVLGSFADTQINKLNISGIQASVIDLTGKTTITQSAAIIKKAAAVVGSETSLAHIACAVGTPNLILLGGGHFGRFMPYSKLTSVIALPLSCFGCNWQCELDTVNCIRDIEPEAISSAFIDFINSSHSKTIVYLQSSYKYSFLSGMPAISEITNLLSGDYEIRHINVKNKKEDIFLNELKTLLKLSDFRKLTDLYNSFENNVKDFNKFERTETLVSALLNQFNDVIKNKENTFKNDPFYWYLRGLICEYQNNPQESYDNLMLSAGVSKNIRVLYKLALLSEKLALNPLQYFFYLELQRSNFNNETVKTKLKFWQDLLSISKRNILTPIDESLIKFPWMPQFEKQANPVLSIIVPSKNRADGLAAFMNSLALASYKISYEILLYIPEEEEQYSSLIKKYNIKKVFKDSDVFNSDQKFSWTKLMNHGFAHSEGEWIMYGSDDIVLHPFAFNFALQQSGDPKIGGISFLHRNTIQDYDGYFKHYGHDVYGEIDFINFGIIRKTSFLKTGKFDETFNFYCGDADICWQLIANGFKIIPSYFSLVEHINIEDKLKKENSGVNYRNDLNNFLLKWNKYILSLNQLLIKDRKFIQNPIKLKNTIYELSKMHNVPDDYLFEIDSTYQTIAKNNKESDDEILVSAVISTYNSEFFIRECIEDLLAQSLYKKNKMEIIVIDSGSQQNECDIIKEYQNKYSNLVYERTEKETIYQAWNRGIKLARGKYITNANTDDRHDPLAFEKMAMVLNNSSAGVVYADLFRTEIPNDSLTSNTEKTSINWMDFDADLLLFGCYIGPQPLWRKSLHEKHGYFDDDLKVAGDYEFWLRVSQTEKFYHIPEKLGLYLYSETSAEHREKELTEAEDTFVKNKYLIKHITSERDLERISKKIEYIGQLDNFKDYAASAGSKLSERMIGLKIEEQIKSIVDHITDFDDTRAIHNLEQTFEIINSSVILINKDKYNELLCNLLGTLYIKEGNIEKSKQYFETALQINSESSEACFGLAQIFASFNNIESAKIMTEYALSYSPDSELYLQQLKKTNSILNLPEDHFSLADLISSRHLN